MRVPGLKDRSTKLPPDALAMGPRITLMLLAGPDESGNPPIATNALRIDAFAAIKKRVCAALLMVLGLILGGSGQAAAGPRVFDAPPDSFGLLIVDVDLQQSFWGCWGCNANVESGRIITIAIQDSSGSTKTDSVVIGKCIGESIVFAAHLGRCHLVEVRGMGYGKYFDMFDQMIPDTVAGLEAQITRGNVTYIGTLHISRRRKLATSTGEFRFQVLPDAERRHAAFQEVAKKARKTTWDTLIRGAGERTRVTNASDSAGTARRP